MFGSKSTFGGSTSSFASSSFGTSSPFAQNTSAFGTNKTLGTGFGTPSFGAAPPNNAIFNTSGTSGGSIFGAGTSNFGQPSTSSTGFGFPSSSSSGSGLFGTNTQQNAGSSLFQSSSSAFGAPKLSFGGFGGNTGSGLFGTTQPTSTPFGQTSTSSLFGSSTGSSFTSAFGTPSAGSTGTAVKFNPVTGTDTMLKNGVTTNINIRHQCITVMKEYESKSLEELRMEDYLANRKGPQQSTIGSFGNSGQGSMFSNTSTGSTGLFQNKSLFGSAFGTNTTAPTVFGQSNQQQSTGLFGQKSISFGTTTTTTTPFTFGTSSTSNLFGSGSNTTKSLFGSTANPTSTPGLFGTTNTLQQSTGFGTQAFPSGFGAQNITGGLFGPKSTFGGTTTTTSTFPFGGSVNTSTGTSLFSNNKANTGFGVGTPFGSASTGFGSVFGANANTGTSLFNQNKTASSFGTATGFGTNLNTFGQSNAPLFGASSANKTGGVNLGLNFGGSTGSTFGLPLNIPANTMALGSDQSVAQLNQQQFLAQQQLMALAHSPYGDNPLFRLLLESNGKREEVLKPTNPTVQKALAASEQYKISPHPTAKVKPKPIHAVVNGKKSLFDGLDDEVLDSTDAFIPRRSIKKLVLKPNNDQQKNTLKNSIAEDLVNETNHIVTPTVLSAKKNISPLTVPVTNNSTETSPKDASQPSPKDQCTPESVIGKYYTNPIMKPVAEHPLRNHMKADTTLTYLNVNNSICENDDSEKENVSQDISSECSAENDSEPELIEGGDQQPHPTQIVLRRPGYYTIPSLEELAQLVDAKGNCHVENFTVGREGFGNIYFFGLTNVFGLNLDEIVHFRKKEVTVYPDDENKPCLGEGLNKKAQITLDGVWPTDKTTCKPIKCPQRLKTVRYQEKLERASHRLGAKFIDYRPETGSWVFQVSHFSKYGLEESDEDDDVGSSGGEDLKKLKMLATQQTRQQVQHNSDESVKSLPGLIPAATQTSSVNIQQTSVTISGLDHEINDYHPVNGDDDDEMEDVTQFTHSFNASEYLSEETDTPYTHSSHRLALALGVSSQRMQVMKASLFGDSEEMDVQEEKKKQAFEKSDELSSYINIQHLTKSSRPLAQPFSSDTSFGSLKKDEYMLYTQRQPVSGHTSPPCSKVTAASPLSGNLKSYVLLPSGAASPTLQRRSSGPIRRIVPLSKSLLNHKSNLLADAACFNARRFRVGWGPNWVFTHFWNPSPMNETAKDSKNSEFIYERFELDRDTVSFAVAIEKVQHDSFDDSQQITANYLEQNLETMLNNSKGSIEEGCPLFVPIMGVTVFHQLAELSVKFLQDKTLTNLNFAYHQYWEQVWNLCVALWGHIPDLDSEEDRENTYVNRMARRRAFSEWLQSVSSRQISNEIEESATEDHLNAIFIHLSGCQISDACHLAQKCGDHGLALLLTQAVDRVECREMVRKQLQSWEETKADCFISHNRMKLYALLAGCLVWSASEEIINTCETLDWKRSLGIHLWFSCSPTASIADALSEYRKAFKGNAPFEKYCGPPSTPYMENISNHNEAIVGENDRYSVYDTCYHLLALYVKKSHRLERLLCPTTSTSDHLDHRLSWLLYQSLQGLGYQHLSEYRTNSLHLNFSSQLESLGLWHWAVFVAMHLTNAEKRYTVVQELLNQHISLMEDNEKEDFLCNKLLVPPEWISKAKALKAHKEGNSTQEAWHLMKAGKWNQSHELILQHIASDAIINEQYDYLKSFLTEFSLLERNSSILDWNIGGQVFLDFIHITETLDKIIKGELNTYELESLQPEVASLCNRVGNINCKTAKDRLCQSEMAKQTANLLRLVLTLQNPGSEPLSTYLLAPHLQHLPMPEDYALQELQALIHNYLLEMTR